MCRYLTYQAILLNVTSKPKEKNVCCRNTEQCIVRKTEQCRVSNIDNDWLLTWLTVMALGATSDADATAVTKAAWKAGDVA